MGQKNVDGGDKDGDVELLCLIARDAESCVGAWTPPDFISV